MPLPAGTRLGDYEIGAGGMGELYRARDTQLGRDAAIKILRSDVASDALRRKRFEEEARAASALNHPNIITIYQIGDFESSSFIAMELVNGTTLRERLEHGPLELSEVRHIARQLCEGLQKAHDSGVVHGDLKPDNVMVTRDGLVKIVDFGLAQRRARRENRRRRVGSGSRDLQERLRHHRRSTVGQRHDHHRHRRGRVRHPRLSRCLRRRDRREALALLYHPGTRRARQRLLGGRFMEDGRRAHVGHRRLRSRARSHHMGHGETPLPIGTGTPAQETTCTPTAPSLSTPTPAS